MTALNDMQRIGSFSERQSQGQEQGQESKRPGRLCVEVSVT